MCERCDQQDTNRRLPKRKAMSASASENGEVLERFDDWLEKPLDTLAWIPVEGVCVNVDDKNEGVLLLRTSDPDGSKIVNPNR